MAALKPRLRDRDGILTKEGLIFRVFGYTHPADAYVCDAEYASAKIFTSRDPRAPRTGGGQLFYKFYDDEGLKFVFKNYPQHTFRHEMLGVKLVGVHKKDIAEARQPKQRLEALASEEKPQDKLVAATLRVLTTMLKRSGLETENFGVFGSMLHGFHHPDYSDIDLLVYGRNQNAKTREVLAQLYSEGNSGFRNEFESDDVMAGKKWRFKNFCVKEFIWHQRRKQIYGIFDDRAGSGRIVKAEFEPVKEHCEIFSEYDPEVRIVRKDWVRLKARVVADADAPFIPSVYSIEPLEVQSGPRTALDAIRVVSYMEEFRQQALKDETVIIEGALEEVVSPKGSFHQITLTYCPRYYEQVLKVDDLRL